MNAIQSRLLTGSIPILLTLTVMATGAVKSASAQIFNYNSSIPTNIRNDGPFIVGDLFRVGSIAANVTELGIFDVGQNGLASNTQVGIWNANGSILLGSVTVTNGDALNGNYRYHPLSSSVTLAANTSYVIGAQVGATFENFLDKVNGSPFTTSSNFTIIENRFRVGSTLSAPINNGTGTLGRWGPANALVSAAAAPEPGTFALLVIGMLGFVAKRRKSKAV